MLDVCRAFSIQTLPDLLPPHPRIVFIGTAASRISAASAAYYANPSNKFWRTLHAVGLTPRLFAAADYAELAALSIGLTDLCKTQSGMDHEISAFDVAALTRRLEIARPRALAFTSKKAASLYLGRPTHKLSTGAQADHETPRCSYCPRRPAPRTQAGASSPGKSWRIGFTPPPLERRGSGGGVKRRPLRHRPASCERQTPALHPTP